MIQKEQGARAAHLSITYMCIEMHFLMWVGGCYISNAFRYVVVGISNSVLSILTANFPVRIEKRKFV